MCELDIIFNFEKAYFILDEFLMGGEIQETSKQTVNRCIESSDMLQEVRRTHRAARARCDAGRASSSVPSEHVTNDAWIGVF